MYLSVLCLQKSVDVGVVVAEEIFQRFIFQIKLCGNELDLCKCFTLSPLRLLIYGGITLKIKAFFYPEMFF